MHTHLRLDELNVHVTWDVMNTKVFICYCVWFSASLGGHFWRDCIRRCTTLDIPLPRDADLLPVAPRLITCCFDFCPLKPPWKTRAQTKSLTVLWHLLLSTFILWTRVHADNKAHSTIYEFIHSVPNYHNAALLFIHFFMIGHSEQTDLFKDTLSHNFSANSPWYNSQLSARSLHLQVCSCSRSAQSAFEDAM